MVLCKRQRARSIEDKARRREDLLQAARDLFLKHGVLATVAAVARRARVAKGTVYLYFRTKEEIYLEHYATLMEELLVSVARAVGQTRDRATARTALLDRMTAFLRDRPEFLRLASLLSTVLESNVSREMVLAYKRRVIARLLEAATAVAAAFPPMTPVEAGHRLLWSYALAVGLWQQAEPPPLVARLIQTEPDLSLMQLDFSAEIRPAVERLWES